MQYTAEELEEIIDNDFVNNPLAFSSGRRNNDAVDLSIMCHCIGKDAFELIKGMRVQHDWDETRWILTLEHMERVEPYLNSWGKGGTMEAMLFCLDY